MNKQIIVLAAGRGSRMKSELPKVMHKIGGVSMLEKVISNCYQVTQDLVLVYSSQLEPYLGQFQSRCKLVEQKEQLGTAHAVSVCQNLFDDAKDIGVIYGDSPFITAEIITQFFSYLKQSKSSAITLAFEYDYPNEYGRIIVNSKGDFEKIVEFKFANDQEKSVKLCNSGIMAFSPGILKKYIGACMVKPSVGKEMYLTEIIGVCKKAGEKVSFYHEKNPNLLIGVNTQDELEVANLIAGKGTSV